MAQTTIDFIGFAFLLKIATAWGLVTMLVSLIITAWQRITGQTTGWTFTERNRRAAIIRHYPEANGD